MPERTPTDRRLRIAEIALGTLIALLLLLHLLGAGSLTEEGVRALAREEMTGIAAHMTLQNGDSYQITIDADPSPTVYAASRGLLSAVSVEADFPVRVSFGHKSTATFAGAGVIYRLNKATGDAFVLTNYHVVYNAASLTGEGISDTVRLYLFGSEDRPIEATFLGGSPYYDLALLCVRGSDVLRTSAATAATFADSDEVAVLDTAIAIGNPASGGISATAGHVSVVSESITMSIVTNESEGVEMRVMRIDTPVNSGNSGGGLFNERGELIGIVNAKYGAAEVENIGYAIPSSVVRYVAENILDHCNGEGATRVVRCMLGITLTAADSHASFDTVRGTVRIEETVTVGAVTVGSLADGVLRVGDVVRRFTLHGEEHPVTRTYHLIDPMLGARVGDTLTLSIERDGVPLCVSIRLTEACLVPW